jgi:putative hydrolase of the HAD superfamily
VSRRWIGFDLDGTLHDLSVAQVPANDAIFSRIHQSHGLATADLDRTYHGANADYLSPDAFSSGHDAKHHRTARMQALLEEFGVEDNDLAAECAEIYGAEIAASAVVFPDTLPMFERLKAEGFQIAIITERAHDSGLEMLECLNIDGFIDHLVTAGGERMTKPDGLIKRALGRMDCDASQTLYVGDKYDRDVVPAAEAGMVPVWFAPDVANAPKDPPNLKIIQRLSQVLELID